MAQVRCVPCNNRRPSGSIASNARLAAAATTTVYQAYDPTLDRRVAIKVPHPSSLADPEFVARFRQEALTAARLSHPNIVTIFDVGEADGVPYIAMELLDGLRSPVGWAIRTPLASDSPPNLARHRCRGRLRPLPQRRPLRRQAGQHHCGPKAWRRVDRFRHRPLPGSDGALYIQRRGYPCL